MKRLVPLLLILFCFVNAAFAYESWFSPYPASFNVNLNDIETYTGAISTGDSAKGWNSDGYNDLTLVAVAGITGLSLDDMRTKDYGMKVDVTLRDGEWNYVSASEPFLKRPFALDFISCNSSNDGARKVTRRGYGSSGEGTVIVPLSPDDSRREAWVDIVLYLPKGEGEALNSALSASDYYCSLEVNLVEKNKYESEWKETGKKWTFTFNGYIEDEPDMSYANIFFNIQPYPAAVSLSVKDLLVDRREIEIGEYDYETQAFLTGGQTSGGNDELVFDYQNKNRYFIFASASPSASVSDSNGFIMYYEGDSTSKYNFPYEIVMTSSSAQTGFENENSRNKTGVFDGKASIGSSGNDQITGLVEAGKIVESLSTVHSGSTAIGRSLVFRDIGTISIRYPQDAKQYTEDTLNKEFIPGVYSSNVYFHIISDM